MELRHCPCSWKAGMEWPASSCLTAECHHGGDDQQWRSSFLKDLWIPVRGTFMGAAELHTFGCAPTPRRYHCMVALPDGSILVSGGNSSGTAFLTNCCV
jgi:hypothetical protein